LVTDPIELKIKVEMTVPKITPIIILHDATLVYSNINKPIKINIVEVSPEEPGIAPIKESHQV
jgi:hypothetical protein